MPDDMLNTRQVMGIKYAGKLHQGGVLAGG